MVSVRNMRSNIFSTECACILLNSATHICKAVKSRIYQYNRFVFSLRCELVELDCSQKGQRSNFCENFRSFPLCFLWLGTLCIFHCRWCEFWYDGWYLEFWMFWSTAFAWRVFLCTFFCVFLWNCSLLSWVFPGYLDIIYLFVWLPDLLA